MHMVITPSTNNDFSDFARRQRVKLLRQVTPTIFQQGAPNGVPFLDAIARGVSKLSTLHIQCKNCFFERKWEG